MSNNVKIIIGANYGDEGKGLLTRHFVTKAQNDGYTPIVIFHNGTAQRGHTVDYRPDFRHVYHHFGSGTGDGTSTFFAESFYVHPMEFHREFIELIKQGITPPISFCDPDAKTIAPFDMLVDHATEEWIAIQNGEREFGSCGFGSWCAIEDRYPRMSSSYTVIDFQQALIRPELMDYMLNQIWIDCMSILAARGVDLERTTFKNIEKHKTNIINNFINDLRFFFAHTAIIDFHSLYNNTNFDSFIFENGQGLGLDMDVKNDWHTTSKTGLYNPYNMLKNESSFEAEVCYVTRSYLTRHSIGPLEEQVKKSEINAAMHDKTNVPNEFQGGLRYGYIEDNDQTARIINDYSLAINDNRFSYNIAVTHANEFDCENTTSAYVSYTPFNVIERN